MFFKKFAFGFFLFFICLSSVAQAQMIPLSGHWIFKMDSLNEGIRSGWFSGKLQSAESVYLPGSLLENHKGIPVSKNTNWTASLYDSSWYFDPRIAPYRQPGHIKLPFFLTPDFTYVGPAWYQRSFQISHPSSLNELYLERPHGEVRVWIDGVYMGSQYGLSSPMIFTLPVLKTGIHLLTIRCDNRLGEINVGRDSHSVTDQTQGNWNGLVGRLEIRQHADACLSAIRIYPDLVHKSARVEIFITSSKGLFDGKIQLRVESFNTNQKRQQFSMSRPLRVNKDGDSLVLLLNMGPHPYLWDEFQPTLYKLRVSLISRNSNKEIDEMTQVFGMRSFGISGTHFTLNGHPIYLRGTVENCEFPLTGYPPTDLNSWMKIFRKAKSYGLNHMRFHSYCPPDSAFQAADETGFYLQIEGPSWANHGSSLGDGKPIDSFLYRETERIDRFYGNHPSFTMMAYGNEPKGSKQVAYLSHFIHYWENRDSRHLYTGASVGQSWPLVADNQYMVKAAPRGLSWAGEPETESDYSAVVRPFTIPYLTHEMGQWCAFPDFKEISLYTGVYHPGNLEIFRDLLQRQGMADQADAFLNASGALQLICYKMEIEKSLRTSQGAGFQLLGLTDYTGQGTALVGVLNAFWKEKGYADSADFSSFCNAIVPLVRLPRFIWSNQDTLKAGLEIFHYGPETLYHVNCSYRLFDLKTSAVLKKGVIVLDSLQRGGVRNIGDIAIGLGEVKDAACLRLEVKLEGTSFQNHWDVWVYPDSLNVAKASSIYMTDCLDSTSKAVLDTGGVVFLNAFGMVQKGKEVVQRFTPVFWNTSWFKMRPPHTMGLVVDTSSAAFRYFPTSYHSDLNWYDLLLGATPMHLEDFPSGFRPLIQCIDTYFMNRKLGLLFEARIGKGRLLVSSLNLMNPESNLGKRQLLYSLNRYMLSEDFNPLVALNWKMIVDLFSTPSKFVFKNYSINSPDELKVAAHGKTDHD